MSENETDEIKESEEEKEEVVAEEEKKEVVEQTAPMVHLHCHSEYSSLDGGSKITDMPEKLKSLGMASMALTDHGVMQGIPEFYTKLRKAGIKPIIGLEAYLTEDQADKKGQTWHITLLAENDLGYKNLCKISSWAFINGTIMTIGRPRARADWKLLEKYSEGIICLTGCMAGPVMNEIMIKGDLTEARRNVQRMIDIFGRENVYGEIQNVGIITAIPPDSELAKKLDKKPLTAEEAQDYESPHGDVSEDIVAGDVPISQTEANAELIEICKDFGLKYAATGDVHYLNEEDADPHDAMICIGTGQVKRGKRRFSLLPKRYHMRSADEMLDAVKQWPESLETTLEIADRCNVELEWGKELLPRYPYPDDFDTSKEYLRHLCLEGLEERYPEGHELRDDAFKRLDYELGVIDNMGYNDYFLIVWDFYNKATEMGIPSGPGRGCLTGDVPIWTTKGYKNLKDVKIGDEIITHTGQISSVKRTWEYDCDEPLLEIKSVYGDKKPVKLTYDHKVLARRLISNPKHHKPREYSGEEWVKAEELKKGDQVAIPRIDDIRESKAPAPERIDLACFAKTDSPRTDFIIFEDKIIERKRRSKNTLKSIKDWADEFNIHPSSIKSYLYGQGRESLEIPVFRKLSINIEKKGYENLDEWRAEVRKGLYLEVEIPRYLAVDHDFCYLLGLMVSDGCIHKRDSNVAWCERTSESNGEMLEAIQKVWGKNISEYHCPDSRGKDVHSYIFKSILMKKLYLSLMPGYDYKAHTKSLPDWYSSLNQDNTQALLEGLWKGDGHNYKREQNNSYSTGYTTSSHMLAEQVRTLLWKNSLPASIALDERSQRSHNGGFKNARDIYRIVCPGNFSKESKNKKYCIEENYIFTNIREINKLDKQKRKVYDIETDSKDHSYLTSSFIVHNSAAGAIVAYTLDITKLDPLENKLLFERFLNPDRQSMPDIDADFGVKKGNGRDELIKYVQEKYNTLAGAETAVSQIVTFSKFKAKGAIRDAARVLAEPTEEGRSEALKLGDRLASMIPDDPKATMKSVWKDKDEGKQLRTAYARGGMEEAVIKQAGWLEDLVRAYSTHAAAVIISDHDLTEDLPLQKLGDKKDLETQYDMRYAEQIGLLKMDFLGLKNLDIIWDAVDKIEHVHGKKIRPYKDIPIDDIKTYEMLASGQSIGVFQFESSGMQGALREIVPTEFNDLTAAVAAYRPGAMIHIPTYAARKNGREEVTFMDPRLEEITGETYAVTLYQEQSMLIARELAGFTPAQADDLRKAIGKKLHDKMAALKDPYIKGCVANGVSKADAESLWADNEAAADYSFNKCLHSQTRVILPDGKRLRLSEAYNQGVTEIMSMWSDGEVRPHKIKQIVSTGKKPLYHIKTESGRQIKATKDHRLLTNEGYLEVKDIVVGKTELITMPMISDKQREARSETMKKLASRPERKEQDKRASERMKKYQAARPMEDKVAHMKKMHSIHPDLTKNGTKAMHDQIKILRETDPEWVARHTEKSLASVRATYDTGPGYGHCSIASNGMWCASKPEREMCEYLIDLNIDFEMHKVLPNGRICDFYFDGLYWEMDGMDRVSEYFEDKYKEVGLPYVVVTPEDYKQIVSQKLKLEHAENGDPVVSIEYWGEGPTYDIEMESDGPKNFMANGIASHNSHAACYAYLAYLTAYLKANYPEEYMAALLSSAMGHKDKPRLYLTEAKRMGLAVLPPEINRSLKDFAVQRNEEDTDKLEILFGLNAIKGVGGAVVDSILEEREARGNFLSIYDLIRRMPKLTKAAVQALIKAGALDSFGSSRKALFDASEELILEVRKALKDEEKAWVNKLKAEIDGTVEIPVLAEEKKDKWKLTALGRKGVEAAAKAYHLNDQIEDEALLAEIKIGLEKEMARAEKARLRAEAKKAGSLADVVSGIASEEGGDIDQKQVLEDKAEELIASKQEDILTWSEQMLKINREAIKEVLIQDADADGLEAAMEEATDAVLDGEEWPDVEKLNIERQMLGVYVSGHPLEKDKRKWANYVTKGLGQLDDSHIGHKHKIVGAIVDFQPIRTKAGKNMARLTLEDLTGARDLIIFPDTYEGGPNQLLEMGNVLYFGVSIDEDTFQQSRKDKKNEEAGDDSPAEADEDTSKPIRLTVNEFFRWEPEDLEDPDVSRKKLLESQAEVRNDPIIIELKKDQFTATLVKNLRQMCKENPGDAPVRLNIDGEIQKTELTIDGGINLTTAMNDLFA